MKTVRDPYQLGVAAYHAEDFKLLQKLAVAPTLTQSERSLLKMRLHFRRAEYLEAIELAKATHPTENYLRGEKEMLVANAYSYLADWKQALLHDLEAFHFYRLCNDRTGQFRTAYNISVDFNRMGEQYLSDQYLAKASNFAITGREKCVILRAEACSLSAKGDMVLAVEAIEQALGFVSEINGMTAAVLRSVAADIFFRAGRREQAFQQYQALQGLKVVYDQDRVKFEMNLLQRLLLESPPFSRLEPPHTLFPEAQEYRIKWQILHSLQGGDVDLAARLWVKLSQLFPNLYAEGFTVRNQSELASIFMVFLNALRVSQPRLSLKGYSRVELLVRLLQDSEFPLRKEQLIEEIWQEPYRPALDQRLYKLIERAKRTLNVEIVNHHSSYSLRKERKQA